MRSTTPIRHGGQRWLVDAPGLDVAGLRVAHARRAGRIHAVLDERGVRYFTGDASEARSFARIPGANELADGFIRIDPTSGAIAVLSVGVESGIYLVKKPGA